MLKTLPNSMYGIPKYCSEAWIAQIGIEASCQVGSEAGYQLDYQAWFQAPS